MTDYSLFSVEEAVNSEICKQFVEAIKRMDDSLARQRMKVLVQNFGRNTPFIDIAARFNSLLDSKTSADF
jgi:hypothetical protein